MPCHPARAGKPLKKGRAVAVRLHPFAVRLRDRTGGETGPLDPGIDPGSRRTGLAPAGDDGEVLFLAEIRHRGARIRTLVEQRAGYRRRRRSAGPRHRKERFLDRRSGRRLPPSLLSRADGALSWTERFGRLRRVLADARAPLHDAAAASATRRVLFEGPRRTGLPVSGSSGGRTESGRARPGIPKTHALDTARVGETPAPSGRDRPVPGIKATGRGPHARTRANRIGFPVGHLMARKSVRGFRTGGIVRATVPPGRRQGVHAGRVAVRANGSFNVQAAGGTVQGVPHRRCRIIRRGDGCGCRLGTSPRQGETATMRETRDPAFLPALKDGDSSGAD